MIWTRNSQAFKFQNCVDFSEMPTKSQNDINFSETSGTSQKISKFLKHAVYSFFAPGVK